MGAAVTSAGLEDSETLGAVVPGDELGDRPLGLVGMGQTRAVVGKARVLDHVGNADGGIKALGHRLHGGRDRDPTAVARLVDVARAGDVGAAALAPRNNARCLVHRRIGAYHGMDRLEQR
jgi:hypothetical protein